MPRSPARAAAQPRQRHLALGGLERPERRQTGGGGTQGVLDEEAGDGAARSTVTDSGSTRREATWPASRSSGAGPPSRTTEGAQPIDVEGGVAHGTVGPVDEDHPVRRHQDVVGPHVAVDQRRAARRRRATPTRGRPGAADGVAAHGCRSRGAVRRPANSAQPPNRLRPRSARGSSAGTGLGVSSSCMADRAVSTVSSSPASQGWRGGLPSTTSKASATQSPSS